MTAYREKLEEQLGELFQKFNNIHIYGTGIVAKRFYKVLCNRGFDKKVTGFVVTKKENESKVYEKPVYTINEITDVEVVFLIAVGDAYQNEIINNLRGKKYKHIINCYAFSFLDEEYISKDFMDIVPDEIEIDINELMMMQFVGQQFVRYDALVELYNLEHDTLDNENRKIEYLLVDPQLKICDSAEKVAILLYQRRKNVKVIVCYDIKVIHKDINWLEQQARDEQLAFCKLQLNKMRQYWCQPFVALIWPPAAAVSDEIVADMKKSVRIVGVEECIIQSSRLEDFIRKIYDTDDSLTKQIENKIKRIKKEQNSKIIVVTFCMENPEFYIKRYGHTISKEGMNLKKILREKYRGRIDDYVFDVIMHTTDNYAQSEAVRKIIEEFTS